VAIQQRGPDWFGTYTTCTNWAVTGCDLSYTFQVIANQDNGFIAQNSQGISSNFGAEFAFNQGHASGSMTWTLPVLHFATVPGFSPPLPTAVTLPFTFTGRLQSSLPDGTPFFDYNVSGTGQISTAVLFADANQIIWDGATLTFNGEADANNNVPEPGTYPLIGLGLGFLAWRGRRARREVHRPLSPA
jgi:hypothetical protein